MYKVKFFRENSTNKLESSINNFLMNQTPAFELIDVKYVYNETTISRTFSALVIYHIN